MERKQRETRWSFALSLRALERALLAKIQLRIRKAPGKRTQNCWTLHVASVLLGVVVQSLKPVKLLNQQLPTFLLFRDNRSVALELEILLHGSFNIIGASQELGRLSNSRLQSLMGCVLPPTHCRSQHCWELLHLFADHCQRGRDNSYHCWRP